MADIEDINEKGSRPSTGDLTQASDLAAVASQLAAAHKTVRAAEGQGTILEGLANLEAKLRAAYQRSVAASEEQPVLPRATEWLLDNFYLAELALRRIRDDMPAGYYQRLPRLDVRGKAGQPRVLAVARALTGVCRARLDIDLVTHFVRGYQREMPLTMGELWAIPTMLRVAVLEVIVGAVASGTDGRQSSAADSPLLAEGADRGIVVADSFTSLRTLDRQDWEAFFETVSHVEAELREDPPDVYRRMDSKSRDRYRKVVEELARGTGSSEPHVAREAVRLAAIARREPARSPRPVKEQIGSDTGRASHVGYYLVDAGRTKLEAHVGYRPPLGTRARRWVKERPTSVYLGAVCVLTCAVLGGAAGYASATGGDPLELAGVALLTLLPASAMAVSLVNWLVMLGIPPTHLPRLDFSKGIPSDFRTTAVIPALVSTGSQVTSLVRQLESHYLANSDGQLAFGLLTDFADAPRRAMPEDAELLRQLKAGVQELNDKHGTSAGRPFYLLHRNREWNPGEECWMGWERKRGKLIQLNRLILNSTDEIPFDETAGDVGALRHVSFVITLDADTELPPGSARRLIGTLAHTLNRPRFDEESGKVVAGYTVLQPRTEIDPSSAGRTLFAQVFAGDSGVDLYSRAVSDVYQDLFGEGIYAGKGIYDVAAFSRSLSDRVPDNALLSHDLFEGIHGRAGLVTDVILYEDFPSGYIPYTRRLHRWVRGDWQLLPWLSPRAPTASGIRTPSGLSSLDRWKILDNLRRSLLAPASLLLLILGWTLLPGSPLAWTAAVLLAQAVAPLTAFLTGLTRGTQMRSLRAASRSLWEDADRWLLRLAFLPYEAMVSGDAIVTTLVRLYVTHEHLLQWTTAAHTARLFRRQRKVGIVWKRMGAASVFALAIAAFMGALTYGGSVSVQVWAAAGPLLCAWLISPYLAHYVSRPRKARRPSLAARDRDMLRRLARRTWLYFEEFVGPDDSWLPPDHFQEDPLGIVAHRTSPTNIGLLLLSTLAAHDLGYVGPDELALRLQATIDNLDRLERYRGHFLNWYDTRDLRPLPPRYVSTVDSGNLAGCLIALAQGCAEMGRAPIFAWERWQGLLDGMAILSAVTREVSQGELDEPTLPLRDHLTGIRQDVLAAHDRPGAWGGLIVRINEDDLPAFERQLLQMVDAVADSVDSSALGELRVWLGQVRRHVRSMLGSCDRLAPWLLAMLRTPELFSSDHIPPQVAQSWRVLTNALPEQPRIGEVPAVCNAALKTLDELVTALRAVPDWSGDSNANRSGSATEALEWCTSLVDKMEASRASAKELAARYQDLQARAQRYIEDMGFAFLYDEQAGLFHIGYNVEAGALDPYYYDLLASEARIAGLVAIAKGDVPQSHWLHLSRPFAMANGRRVLLSWSGSMFEYLMPALLMRTYPGTLLDWSLRAAVAQQIAYANAKGVPWGISESACYRFTAAQGYHYEASGVPGLAFKRGLADYLVIAPYASLLAVGLEPQAVARNARRLNHLGALGRYGFYEAVDYTPEHVPAGHRHAVVRSYYAHHHGMSLVALANLLRNGPMVQRFHSDLRVRNVEKLLYEQVPSVPTLEAPRPEEAPGPRASRQADLSVKPWTVADESPHPEGHVLSNGHFTTFITSAGAGYSSCDGTDLTRWGADGTQENQGTWIYVQDTRTGKLWSATGQPVPCPAATREVTFHPHKVQFRCDCHGILLTTDVVVVPENNVEVRLVRITNRGARRRRLRLASYAEVILCPQEEDRRHPAFNKLFIESEHLADINGLLFWRRRRAPDEEPTFLVHLVATRSRRSTAAGYETDRARFVGRGRTAGWPAALEGDGCGFSGTTGATLDPIFSLAQNVELRPYASAQIAYVTIASSSRQDVLSVAKRYQDRFAISRAINRAKSVSEGKLRQTGLATTRLRWYGRVLSALLYPSQSLRSGPTTLAANTLGQTALWTHGLSGDYPIVLVRAHSEQSLTLLRELLAAHAYWRQRLIKVDLVVLNEEQGGYNQPFGRQLHRLVSRKGNDEWLNQRGGIFIVHDANMSEAERTLLATSARAVLAEDAGPLADQIAQLDQVPSPLPALIPTRGRDEPAEPTAAVARPEGLLFDNGYGGFTPSGQEYAIYLKPGQWTPVPWINVIANPEFGFLVSEAGGGYTWAGNSGENRLTPWRNDPICDDPGEALYLRDEETGEVWSPTPLPVRTSAPYLVRHGAGYTTFEHNSHGIKQQMQVFADARDPVKIVRLRLENTWRRTRRITVTYYAEWVLGVHRDGTQQYIIPEYEPDCQALLARNPYNAEFGDRVAFLGASKTLHGLTADREEFLGRRGSLRSPAALGRVGLSGTVEPGRDPCATMQLHINLRPGESEEIYFVIGQGANRDRALALVRSYQERGQVEASWQAVQTLWDGLLSTVTVETPDEAMNLLLNRWLLYQALSCRIWARSALYQSSGAFGFRDQLQDVMAVVHASPQLGREHILRAARHQFEAGDVLHWWHPPLGRGVRTRISDDLLWLPLVTAHYVETTGDEDILSEQVPFLVASPLEPDEMERYGHYETTERGYSLYEHCKRALARGATAGPRRLPLMGAGDWNDGMNLVGAGGRGESIWLGWFLYAALSRFVPLCEQMGDGALAAAYRRQAGELQRALESSAWDGDWYRRAYYDDGTPLGSAQSLECQIDSIAQSWSVLSGAANPRRAHQAMEAVAERLVRSDEGLMLLFAPPFDQTDQEPGYIKGYPPGIRENGGQYTHAALWAVWAFAELGDGDRAEELFRLLNPIYRTDTSANAERYRVEPYVVAADVYSEEPHVGRGGWTWYTGSAGWMYRLGVECILGLRRVGDGLRIRPCIPRAWPGYTMTYRYKGTRYRIQVENPDGVTHGVNQVLLDDALLDGYVIPLHDDGKDHSVRVSIG